MVAGTLYTYPGYFRGFKATVAAAYSGFDLKTVELNQNDKRSRVPSFEGENKFTLNDANAIAYYVSSEQFRGTTPEAKAEVLQWLNYGSENVVPAVAAWVYPCLSLVESCPAGLKKAEQDMRQVFGCLNDFLKTRTYLVGERMTLADVSLALDLMLAYNHVADEKFRKPYVNVNRWYTTVMNQDKVLKVAGQVTLCSVRQEFCANKFAKRQEEAKAAAPAKEKKPKEAKPPKEQPKKKAKEPEPEDEADEVLAAEPKSKDPFAEMPKGTLNFDELKRVYSNEDTHKVAYPYFWKVFNENKEHYSIWKCEYKYPEDFTRIFMTSNLIGGMFQRIEKLRKNALANMGVYGVDNDNTIAGVWFWKGQELVFPLCDDWKTDYDSYTWTKMSPDNADDRKFLEDCWLHEGEFKGKKFNAGKCFK